MTTFSEKFLGQAKEVIARIPPESVEKVVRVLRTTRDLGGRLFVIGSGGGAGHASHAVCDFRKIGGFEAYCPTDNVSELTARINDDGWETAIANYLKGSRISSKDCVLVFSVGGGSEEKNISMNLVHAVRTAEEVGAKVVGILGRDGGYTAQHSDACVIVPMLDSSAVTAHTEAIQAVVWHLIVAHPEIQIHQMKWESTK
jgi:D-sedoheptulose 7-phosphate isomerase